ncbi:MAG TPA: glycosyltransferase family 4 protein [Thiobacillus sp.]
MKNNKTVVGIITGSAGDWGGASRVLYTNLRLLDRSRIHPVLLLPHDGPIIPELEEKQIDYTIWGALTEPGNPLAYLKAMWRMIGFLRRHKVDILHINHSNSWRPAELLAARLMRVPILMHYHTVNTRPGPFVSLSTAAIAVSDYVMRHSLPARLPKYVVYNPVDLKRFDAARDIRHKLGFEQHHILVSFLGQIRTIKGVGDFIDMAKRIPHPDARFLIAGECRDPDKFDGSYSEADLQAAFAGDPRLRYLGYVSRVEDLYRSSDIVVVPSRWQEPLGLINLEAGACRKPVVATRSGGIPEIIDDGENGFLVDIGDVDALVEKVALLIGDANLRLRMGEAARARVEDDFTTRPVRELEALYERMAQPIQGNRTGFAKPVPTDAQP